MGGNVAIKPRSSKSKGRRLQQFVKDSILKAWDRLQPGDVRSTAMGQSGVDIQLSPYAKSLIPLAIETKNVEKLNVWAAIDQAKANAQKEGLVEAVIISRNNLPEPYAILPWKFVLILLRMSSHVPTSPNPPPRYDDLFFDGVAWLDKL